MALLFLAYRHRIAFMASFNNPSLTESEIRQAVREQLVATGEPGVLVRDELAVSSARVDLARIGSRLEGFEIKSDFDTFDRLPRQVAAFSLLFDTMTLVVGDRYANEAVVAVPRWWGVLLATTNGDGSVRLCSARSGRQNPFQSGLAFAELLWRAEAANALCELAGISAAKSWSSKKVRQRLAESASVDSIRRFAIERIRDPLRLEDWRASRVQEGARAARRSSSFLLAAERGRPVCDTA